MISSRKICLTAALALGALLVMPALSASAGDKVMATVNGKDITEADLALAEADIGGEIGTLPLRVRRRVLVEYLIETRLFAEAAEAATLSSGPDFDHRMAYWRQRALRDAYFDKSVKGSIDEGVAKSVYEDRVKMLPREEEVQARHILVDTEEEAKALADKIGGGADFAALAKETSKDPGTKDAGGLLDYFGRGQMVAPFDEVAFSLKPGEMSKPVKSQFGWHLIRLEDRREKKPPAFEDVRDRIIDAMAQSKAQELARELRDKASIAYVDAEVKRQVEEEAEKAASQKAFEDQLKEQIEKDAGGKK